jgi:hypothetical protein
MVFDVRDVRRANRNYVGNIYNLVVEVEVEVEEFHHH